MQPANRPNHDSRRGAHHRGHPCGLPPHLPSLAARTVMLVACSAPALSIVPRALRHLPWVTASGVAVVIFEYLVLSSTVTAVWVVLPLASLPATLMVFPVTDATEPRTGCGFGGAGVGEPEGAGSLEPGPDAGPGCLGFGQVPLTDGLTLTDAAVTGCPFWASRVGCTVTQLPEVTSPSVAGETSVILVVEVKLTAALLLSSFVTWIEFPATDAIRPLTLASFWACAGEVVVEVTVDVDVDVDVGADLFDEPHAATDKAVTPVTARMASRVSRGAGQLAEINVSPIRESDHEKMYPMELWPSCVTRGQNASSGTRMMSLSMDSMTLRCAANLGSTFLAKNVAVATLPW